MRLAWLAAFFLASLASACSSDSAPDAGPDPGPEAGPVPDASTSACADPPPTSGLCEETHEDVADCPSIEEICAGVCGASYECCFCGDDGEWSVEYTDCPPCPDAGP